MICGLIDMKLFSCDENITTYKIPVIKIVLCSLLIVLLISRNYFIHINNTLWKTIIDIVCFQAGILSILCIYLSVGEMLLLNERKKEDKINIENAKMHSKIYSVDCILSLLEENDIIELSILSNDQTVKLGASSDCRPGNTLFFDKNYYIGNKNNISIEELRETILHYSTDSKVCVIAIDGVPPNGRHH